MSACADILLEEHSPNLVNPQFKSKEQRDVVETALQCDQHLIGILSTGGGKSFSYLLPTHAEENMISFVIVPS